MWCVAVLVYQVDGYGGQTIMDDANIPSLMALPYLGYLNVTDPLYQTTRTVLLSSSNPYFFNGTAGSGVGGPHVGLDFMSVPSHTPRLHYRYFRSLTCSVPFCPVLSAGPCR